MLLSWRVQNIVVIGRVYSKLERSEFSSNFEFDRNMLSGTGACPTMHPLSVTQIRPPENTAVDQGPVSLTVFPSQSKFDGNFVLLSHRLHYRDRYKILCMARQLCCRGMCKNLLRSDGQQRSYGKAKFPSYLNCGQKTVSETGPSLNKTIPAFVTIPCRISSQIFL